MLRLVTFGLAAGLGVTLSPSLEAQRLDVPSRVSIDSGFKVIATGLRPGSAVTLRAYMIDSAGRRWESFAGFRASPGGRIDTSTMPPAHGSYAGIVKMGLVTSMDLPGSEHGRARFTAAQLDSIPLALTLEIDGSIVDSVSVLRWFAAPGIRVRDIGERGVHGRLFLPATAGPHPGVLVLGGSEGGIGGAEVAALLAGRGFAALALAYFALDTLPAELVRIPLEYFTTALEILASEPHVDAKRLGIVGTSKGAEAALLVAARETRLRAVVAFAPSAVSWSCICAEGDAPSWTAENRPVPYVPPGADPTYRPPPGMPIRPVIHFRHRVRDSQAVSRAAIPVDQITAELLLISGAADALWPSQWSGDQIVRRLRRRGHRPPFAHLVFPGAGHLIPKGYLPAGSTRVGGGRLETGGTPAANARAQPEAWAATLRVLHRALARR